MPISTKGRGRDHRPLRVVIAGGGVAALEAMLALGRSAGERLAVELIAPRRDFAYRPLAVAEPFGLATVRRFDLTELTRGAGAAHRVDALSRVDTERRLIHTRAGDEIAYDALLVACGARVREAVPGALTFWGSGDEAPFRRLLRGLETGELRTVAFSQPARAGWPLPLYELALMTAAWIARHMNGERQVILTTPETEPLELFGRRASTAVRGLLERRGIELRCGCYPADVDVDGLRLVPAGRLHADRVVALPTPEGRYLDGLPHDEHGFIPTDRFCRVAGLDDAGVYAAGDATTFPVKQGGIAAQQADVVAACIAAAAGAAVEPKPFRPILRGLLLTGSEPSYLRADISGGRGETSAAASQALWWPPGKIAGHYLAPYLASLAKADLRPPPPIDSKQLRIEVDLLR